MGTKIIMAVCCLPCLLMLYGFLYMEGKQKGNILLGVTLWPGAEQEERVIAIQKRFRREMHILFLLSILLFVLTCIPDRDSVFFSLMIVWLLFIIVIFFFPVAWGNGRLKVAKREWKAMQEEAAVWTEYGVREVYGKYAVEPSLQVDEDEYWIWGMWYYNKNDKRFMVSKRRGMGTTVNMAKTSGKVFTIGISIATVAMLVWVAALVLMEDFVPISLKMENETMVSSQYKKEYSIPIGEIESAELVEELPSMSKRVGSAMDSMLKGSFLDEEYQFCKVCVRRQKPPFIKLLTADGMIYYLNDEEAEVTEQVYQQIIDIVRLRCIYYKDNAAGDMA